MGFYCISHSGKKMKMTGVDQSKEVSLICVSLPRALELCKSPGEDVVCSIFQTTGSWVLFFGA